MVETMQKVIAESKLSRFMDHRVENCRLSAYQCCYNLSVKRAAIINVVHCTI